MHNLGNQYHIQMKKHYVCLSMANMQVQVITQCLFLLRFVKRIYTHHIIEPSKLKKKATQVILHSSKFGGDGEYFGITTKICNFEHFHIFLFIYTATLILFAVPAFAVNLNFNGKYITSIFHSFFCFLSAPEEKL